MIERVRQRLATEGLDVFLASSRESRQYLTGFTGSSGWVWIDQERKILITDFRYMEQATHQCSGWQIVKHDGILDLIESFCAESKINTIAVEGDHLTVNLITQWQEKLPVELIPTKSWVSDLRIIKSEQEIAKIRQAAIIADQAFELILPKVRVGITEIEIAMELEFTMRRLGAEAVSFNPIIASGPQGALPHAQPGKRQLQQGDFVVMDFGCKYLGYCSDMTRTVVLGQPTSEQLKVYTTVLDAQSGGLAALRVGKTGQEIDKVSRDIIAAQGYGDYFGHGLGHGVGLEVHEKPNLSKLGTIPLESGMVVTVEPGIYLPGWGGVRIEDLVVIRTDSIEILSTATKELVVVM